MSTVSLLAVLAGAWGVLMSLAPLLQIRAIVRARSSEGVSLGHLRILLVGFVLWAAYGLSIADPAVIVPNTLAAVVGLTTIVVASKYRPQRRIPTSRHLIHDGADTADTLDLREPALTDQR